MFESKKSTRKNGWVILILGLILIGFSLWAIQDDLILCIPCVGWGVLMVLGGLIQILGTLVPEPPPHHDDLPRDQR